MLPEHDFPELMSNQDSDCWPQLLIAWNSWSSAENVAATRLLPVLAAAERAGRLDQWFFVRKQPHWRLRYVGEESIRPELVQLMHELHSRGEVTSWGHGLYEPEVLAFGGAAAMRTAHALFHHDSSNALAHIARQSNTEARPELGRRELGVLLISTLLRAAEQDWYEQGDVWHRITAHRQATTSAHPHGDDQQRKRMHRLMTADAARGHGPLNALHDWLQAFTTAGRELTEHSDNGRLERGLRAILTHHAIFTFNRLGLPAREQVSLASLAADVVMNDHSLPPPGM